MRPDRAEPGSTLHEGEPTQPLAREQGIEGELLQARLRLHDSAVGSMVSNALLAGAVMLLLMWKQVAPAALMAWAAALAGVIGVRLLVRARQRRAAVDPTFDRKRWLQLYRATYLLHGLAWAAAISLLPPGADRASLAGAAFVVTALIGGSLVTSAFDSMANRLFTIPAAAALFLGLLVTADRAAVELAVTAAAFIAAMAVTGRGVSGLLSSETRARAAERARFDEASRFADEADAARRALADQHAMLQQLIQETQQGFWFIDTEGRTLDANPAMCTLLGRAREELLGRGVFDIFTGPEREVMERQLALRRQGRTGGYEIDVVRPDGSRRHAYNQATPVHDGQGRPLGSIGLWTDLTQRKTQELELRTYERVTNSITDPVCVVGTDRRLILVNDAWCHMFGMTREQALGTPLASPEGGALEPRWQTALDACLATGSTSTVRVSMPVRNGRSATLENSHYPYRDGGMAARSAIVVSRDVTVEERQLVRLQEREAEQRALLSAFPGYITVTDEDFRYVFVHKRFAELVGRPVEQLIGVPLRDLPGAALFQMNDPEIREALDGQTSRGERSYPATSLRDGVDLEVTHVAGPPQSDGRRLLYSFAIDITARNRAREELGAALAEAERANNAKSQFLSHMSHELRTPMNAIVGFAHLLKRDLRPALAEHQLGYVKQIERGSHHLLELINEVLDLSRIEAGAISIDLSTVTLADLLGDCRDFVQELARGHEVQLLPLECAEGLGVRADRRRLRQVLLNLLGNAIKYNNRGGTVRIRCVAQDARVLVEVHDTGRGIQASDRERVFQPFERLDADRGPVEGSGIGLALCRRLMHAMDGDIGFDSEPGAGSRFWIRLPASPAVDLGQALRAPDGGARALTVLCIDDNEVNLLLVESLLMSAPGLRVLTSSDPLEGLRLARQEKPDLVLLDIHMPVMDGYAVLSQLRADAGTRSTPVAAVSADLSSGEIDAVRAAGFDAYLSKPLDPDRLLETVQSLCSAEVSSRAWEHPPS